MNHSAIGLALEMEVADFAFAPVGVEGPEGAVSRTALAVVRCWYTLQSGASALRLILLPPQRETCEPETALARTAGSNPTRDKFNFSGVRQSLYFEMQRSRTNQ